MPIKAVQELFIHELSDTYGAEKREAHHSECCGGSRRRWMLTLPLASRKT